VLADIGDAEVGVHTAIQCMATLLHAASDPERGQITMKVVNEAAWSVALLDDLIRGLEKLESQARHRAPAA